MSIPGDVTIETLQCMRRALAARLNDSSHQHDQRDQLAAIDAEIAARSAKLPWLVTAMRSGQRTVIGEFNFVSHAEGAMKEQPTELLPRVELNTNFIGPFPLAINVAYTLSGERGLALKQYHIDSGREEWVSPIFTGPRAFRDVAMLRNEIEDELEIGVAA